MRLTTNFLAFLIILSCSKDDKSIESLRFSVTDFPQTWKLSYINAGLSGEIIDAEEISIREIYLFNENGTFSKELQDDFVQGFIDGTYDLVTHENVEYLMLKYSIVMDSLSYCSKDNVEHMRISDNGKILSNDSCLAFDGPGMYYQRIE